MGLRAITRFVQTVLLTAGFLCAQTTAEPSATVAVSSNMDIYRSAGFDSFSNGVAPFPYSFPARPGQVLKFLSIIGTWTCNDPENPPYGADGTSDPQGSCYPRANIIPTGTFSGYDNTDYQGAMVGMFLEDTLPASSPPALRFYVKDASQGGIQTDFKILSPLIGQVFFIGDGLTGTASGDRQIFAVPPTATHLYLGYVDTPDTHGFSPPAAYTDNGGGMSVTFQISEGLQR